jgi:hypothetical protein
MTNLLQQAPPSDVGSAMRRGANGGAIVEDIGVGAVVPSGGPISLITIPPSTPLGRLTVLHWHRDAKAGNGVGHPMNNHGDDRGIPVRRLAQAIR